MGSVAALSKLNGSTVQVVERYQYDAFGRTTVTLNGSLSNPYRYTARSYDEESGLYYYRARMYSSQLGRFLQPDPIGYADGMNMYAYCGNNPVNWIDPWGLCEEDKGGGIGIGFSGTGGTGGGGTGGVQIVIDSEGNLGLFFHGGGGGFFGCGGNITLDLTGFAGTINDLNGPFGTVGAGGTIGPGVGVSVGGEYFAGQNAQGGNFQIGPGVGPIPFEMHGFGEYGVVIPADDPASAMEDLGRNSGIAGRIYDAIDELGLD